VLSDLEIDEVTSCQDLAIEQVLFRLKRHVENKEKVITIQKNQALTSKGVVSAKKEQVTKHEFQKTPDSSKQAKLIQDLTDTVNLLQQKLEKMEEMMKVKDDKIKYLTAKLGA